jgi:hypothetical protein
MNLPPFRVVLFLNVRSGDADMNRRAAKSRVCGTSKGTKLSHRVVQSIYSITAAFYMDFLISTHRSPRLFLAFANAAILVFAAFSTTLFHNDVLQNARRTSAGAAIVSLILILAIPKRCRSVRGSLILPWSFFGVLVDSWFYRVNNMPVDAFPATSASHKKAVSQGSSGTDTPAHPLAGKGARKAGYSM